MIDGPIVNRVANSGLITINLENDFPTHEIISFDLKDYLFQGMILKEKDFRLALKEFDWEALRDKHLCVVCTADAIIPQWAYMLVAAKASGISKSVFLGSPSEFISSWYHNLLSNKDYSEFQDARVVVKGCSGKPVPTSAYLDLTARLKPYAQSIMYGEPCSTVPVFKRPRIVAK